MINKIKLVLIVMLFANVAIYAQSNDSLSQSVNDLTKTIESLKKIKITGWVQTQFQWAESRGADNLDGGAFALNSDKRFMIRRGRIKFTYTQKRSQYVMQINASERGVSLVEIFGKFSDPWSGFFTLTAGVMNRPFGFEIDQSSAVRESPERSRFVQMLMPNERDLGAKITFEPKIDHFLYGLKIDAGFYNGHGIVVPGTNSSVGTYVNDGVNEYDFVKDFIGRLAYYRDSRNEKFRFGIGFSHYNGGVINQSNVVYNHYKTDSNGISFAAADTLNGTSYKDKISSRIYYGAEVFFSAKYKLGTTILRGEYIFGEQPGTIDSYKSPSSLPSKTATYIRNFNGAYFYFIHRIANSKHEIVAKSEWIDPNTDVKGLDLNGKNGMTKAEIKFSALGLGYNFYYDENIKFMLYYNMVTNENTQIVGAEKDLKDNILTLRMQYRF